MGAPGDDPSPPGPPRPLPPVSSRGLRRKHARIVTCRRGVCGASPRRGREGARTASPRPAASRPGSQAGYGGEDGKGVRVGRRGAGGLRSSVQFSMCVVRARGAHLSRHQPPVEKFKCLRVYPKNVHQPWLLALKCTLNDT